jgi:hypothetical protein
LVDAYHVPKLLSQQLLLFGRSGDGLEGLTFGVEQVSALSARRGQSVSWWRTVRDVCVRRVFFVFLLVLVFDPSWFQVFVGQGFVRFVIRGASLEVLLPFSDSPRLWPDGPRQGWGQSAIPCRTVRVAFADSPPRLAGQSARAWQLCFLVRFLLPSFVLLRVLQGIVPKT